MATSPKVRHSPSGVSLTGRRLRAAWSEGWQAANSAWQTYPMRDASIERLGAESAPGPRRAGLVARATSRTVRRRLAPVLLVLVVLIVSCGALNVGRVGDALAAVRDVRAQINVIRGGLGGGGLEDPTRLQAMQPHLDAAVADLQRLQADVPGESALAVVPGPSGVVHVLRMASDLARAAQIAWPGVVILAPHLKGMLASVQNAAGDPAAAASSSSSSQAPALTADSVQVAATAFSQAIPWLQAALAERAHVSDGDLSALGMGKYVPALHQLDAYTGNASQVVSALRAVTAALPMLLGVGQPTNFILFSQDSDELRPTGGFNGTFAQLTISSAKLTSGVHLQDIYSLDCPLGLLRCPARPIPSQDAWLQVDPTHFGLRDSNLDPDFPTSARLAEQLIVEDGGPAVQGIISITPAVIENILRITGPITIAQYCTVVSADSLRDVIHFYHLANSLGISSMCPGPQQVTSRKAFDGELGSVLLHRIATMPQAQQTAVVQSLIRDLTTHDIQMYLNDQGLESVVASLGWGGEVQQPRGDALYLVDANTGGNYANADVTEQASDTITLDAHGTATHDVTITYTYPKSSHLYSDLYALNGLYPTLRDFVQVIVPSNAHLAVQQGCTPYTVTHVGRATWACTIFLVQPNSLTLHFRWSVAGAATASDGGLRYDLLVQREAGTHDAVTVSVVPPAGWTVAPLGPPMTTDGHGHATYSGVLTQDVHLSARLQP